MTRVTKGKRENFFVELEKKKKKKKKKENRTSEEDKKKVLYRTIQQ